MNRLPIGPGPTLQDGRLGGIRIDRDHGHRPGRIAKAPCRRVALSAVNGRVNRIEVHSAKNGGQLCRVGDMRFDRLIRQRLYEISLPIPLQAFRIECVEQRLKRRIWHRLGPIDDRFRERRTHGVDGLLGLRGRSVVGDEKHADFLLPMFFRERLGQGESPAARETYKSRLAPMTGNSRYHASPWRRRRVRRRSARHRRPGGVRPEQEVVTTPKFPPPPRSAQKRSEFSVSEAVTKRPSARTISASRSDCRSQGRIGG